MKSSKKIITLFLTIFVLLSAIALTACEEESYTVSFDSVGGSTVESVSVLPGEKVAAPTAPTKDGYVFMGWYIGNTVWNFSTDTVDSDITLIAKWTSSVDADAVTVTFDSKGGSAVESVTVGRGVCMGAPVVPAKPGYSFEGWYFNNEYFDFESTVVVKDMTLIAKWSLEIYNIAYDTAGGQNNESNPASYDVHSADLVINYPQRTGYDFIGWVWVGQTEPVKDLVITNGSTGNIVLTAIWQKTAYAITYDLAGGIAGAEYPASYDVESARFAIANPTRDYYEFLGWTYDGQAEPKRDLTIEKGSVGTLNLVANWCAIEYGINYDLAGGENNPENPASYNVASGIVTIKAPSRMGYTFKGWLYDGIEEPVMEIEIAAASTGERSFTATWEIITYNITYVYENATPLHGTLQATYTVEDLPLYPLSIYNAADHFLGWYTDEALTAPVKYIETCSDITLYAKLVAPTEGIVYTDLGDRYAVSGYEGEESVLYIPEFYNGKPVTMVSDRAFKGNQALAEIYLPATTHSIGEEAFYGCNALTAYNVRLDALLEYIGKLAFADCDSITTAEFGFLVKSIGEEAFSNANSLSNVTFGMSTYSIGASAFENCDKITSITFPESVYSIGDCAFRSCSALAEVKFADDGILNKIGDEAFKSASSITEITIPKSLVTLGKQAFHSASKLTNVNFAKDSKLEKIDDNTFENCKAITAIAIPDSVVSIGDRAFYSAAELASVSFGKDSKLESIGRYSFYNCNSLAEITIPSATKTVGDGAFSGSNSIATIIFAEGSKLESIGVSAFSECSKLTEILVPAGAEVGAWAFYGCFNLKTVQLPASDDATTFASYFGAENYIPAGIVNLTITGGGAIVPGSFEKLTKIESISVPSLNSSIHDLFNDKIPETLTYVEVTGNTSIGDDAFLNCSNIKTIILSDNVKQIEEGALAGCNSLEYLRIAANPGENGAFTSLFNGTVPASLATVELHWTEIMPNAFENTSIKHVILSNELESIGESAFENCKQLTTVTVDLTESKLTSIGKKAFFNCTSLKSYTVNDGLSSIGESAFSECYALEEVNIGKDSKLTEIGKETFSNATALKNFSFPALMTSTGESVFKGCTKLESVAFNGDMIIINGFAFYGCKSLKTVDIKAESKISEIGEGAFAYCSALTSIDVTNEVKTIGIGAFQNCSALSAVNFSEANELENLGEAAFAYCLSFNVIYLPSSVERIQNSTFEGCSSLSSVNFAEGSVAVAIDEGAFKNCTSLIGISIPAGVTTISNGAFQNCYALKNVVFAENNNLSSILAYAFGSCISLETIAIPAGVYTVGESAFEGCTALTAVSFAETNALQSIGSRAFADCDSITTFAIPAGVTELGDYVFFSCQSLNNVVFADGITLSEIPSYAFYECSALTSITLPASVGIIGSYAFYNASALESIVFAEGSVITVIGDSAFRNATSLKSFTAPIGIKAIGEYAFSGCTGLGFVHLNLQIETIGAYAFRNCTTEIRFTEAGDGYIPEGWDTYWNPEFCPITWYYVEPTPAA